MKVKILTPVLHDTDAYKEGDVADLPAAAAKALIDCGAAEELASSKAKAHAEAAEKAAAEKLAAEKAEAEKAEAAALAKPNANAS